MQKSTAVTPQTKAILFDHDGTIIDSEDVHFTIWQDLLASYGVKIDHVFYSDVMAGIPVAQNSIDAVNMFNMSVRPEELTAKKHEMTKAYLAQQPFPLMPHAVETIKKCYDAGFQLAIVTGGSRISVERTLDARNIRHMFSATVAVDDVEHSKPAPDCYQLAMKMIGKAPHECIAIEDTEHGMRAAVRAGVACVAIPTIHSQGHDFTDAAAQYTSLQEWWVKEC